MAGVTGETVAEGVRADGHTQVSYEPTLGRLRAAVNAVLQPGDLVITLGAGDIHRVAQHLAQGLDWHAELSALIKPDSILKRDEPLHKHTTMRIGGPAQLWFEPIDEDDLTLGLKFAHDRGIPVTFIGRGSNLLIRDGGILGLCVHLGRPHFSRIEVEGEFVTVGAGARLKQIVAEARKFGLGGFEFMEGIPGNMGGALRMNAGAMQGWTMEVVDSIRSMDLLGHVHEVQEGRHGNSLPQRAPFPDAHCALRQAEGQAEHEGRNQREAQGLLRQTLDFAARRAERRMHLQESRARCPPAN